MNTRPTITVGTKVTFTPFDHELMVAKIAGNYIYFNQKTMRTGNRMHLNTFWTYVKRGIYKIEA